MLSSPFARPHFPELVVAAMFVATAVAVGAQNAPGPGATTTQPGATTTQGSDSQKQQGGTSATGTQSGGNTTPNSTTGNTPSVGTQSPANTTTGAGSRTGNEPAATQGKSSPDSINTGTMNASAVSRGNEMQVAQYLIIENEGEIAVSQVGTQKATNPAVKQFAEQMVKEHTQMVEKLRPLADVQQPLNATHPSPNSPPSTSTNPNTSVSTAAAPTGQSDGSANVGGISGGGRAVTTAEITGGLDFVAVRRELSAQCLASKRQELESKQGAEFDKCFMGIQLAMHMDAVDTLKVFRKHASGDLQKTIDEALPITQSHLEHAKSTMKSLEGTSAK